MLFTNIKAFIFINFLFHLAHAAPTEPLCSKFSYDEQLLEKMIRTEIKIESMEKEITKVMANALDTVKENALKVEAMEKAMNESMDRALNTVEENKRDMEELLQKFEEWKTKIQKDLESKPLGVSLQPIGFHAHHVTDTQLVKGKTIVFDRTLTNEGSGYDTSSGIFTAPADGLYMFSVKVCTTTGPYAYFELVLENNVLSKSTQYDKDFHTCSSALVVARVRHGERVSVRCHNTYGSSSSNTLLEDDLRWNTFSGALIHT